MGGLRHLRGAVQVCIILYIIISCYTTSYYTVAPCRSLVEEDTRSMTTHGTTTDPWASSPRAAVPGGSGGSPGLPASLGGAGAAAAIPTTTSTFVPPHEALTSPPPAAGGGGGGPKKRSMRTGLRAMMEEHYGGQQGMRYTISCVILYTILYYVCIIPSHMLCYILYCILYIILCTVGMDKLAAKLRMTRKIHRYIISYHIISYYVM